MSQTTFPFRVHSPDGLGKLLFQRRGALFHALMACFVYWPVCLFMPVGLALIIRKQGFANVPVAALAFGVVMCLGMGLMGYLGLAQYRLFRVHEGGVSKRAWGRTRFLLFEEVDRFWFGGGQTYAKGAYVGPSYSLAFYPAPDSDRRPIFAELPSFKFAARQEFSDRELESLRDWMYQVLSERMWQQIQAGQPVDWTKSLRFLPEGLEYQPKGTSAGERQVHPYGSITRVDVDFLVGRLSIAVGDDSNPRIVEKLVRQPNDIPGLILLDRLRRGSTPDGEGKFH
jgi:hypothetical protein